MQALCLFGYQPEMKPEIEAFFQREPEGKLVIIHTKKPSLSHSFKWFSSQRLFSLLSFEEELAKEVGWYLAFLEVRFSSPNLEDAHFFLFQKRVRHYQKAAELLISDAPDFGVGLLKNALAHRPKTLRSALDLKGAFPKTPAIILGAGPSLEVFSDWICQSQDQALILAGGSAIEKAPCTPHMLAAVDPYLERSQSVEVPICFQSRAHPSNSEEAQGLWVPDSHFSFLNWIIGNTKERFDGGWTVSDCLMQLAVLWDCDPIILVGVDLYKKGEPMPQDWSFSKDWADQLMQKEKNRTWIHLSIEDGVRFSHAQYRALEEISLPQKISMKAGFATKLEALPLMEPYEERLTSWVKALKRGEKEVETLLLEPFWQLYQPLFLREVELDQHPFPIEEKLRIQRELFFSTILEEHHACFMR